MCSGPEKGLLVTHLNVRSLRRKIPEVISTLSSQKFHVLSISETWLTPDLQDTIVVFENYNFYRQDRKATPHNVKGGGLAVYVSTKYQTNPEKYRHLNISTPAIESQVLFITTRNRKSFVLANIYRPPAGDKDEFAEHIDKILQEISKERYADLYLTGDFNLDHSVETKSAFTSGLERQINLFGLSQRITGYSRQTVHTKSLIDVMYVKTSKSLTPFILKLTLSDHYLIGVKAELGYQKDPTTSFVGRSYRNYNFEIAEAFYNSYDLNFIFDFNDVNLIWTSLKGYMLACVRRHCPQRTITTKLSQPKWFTKELNELLHDRDQAFKEAYNSPAVPELLLEAKKLRTKAKRSLRLARSDHIKEQLTKHSEDPRKFWFHLNNLINRKPTTACIQLKDNQSIPIDPSQTPNYINEYFSTIGPKLAERFQDTHNNSTQDALNNQSTDSLHNQANKFYFDQISEHELLKEVKTIKTYKSSGIPDLNAKIVKHALIILIKYFTFLCNMSVCTGIVPDDWKKAIVVPIPKISNSKKVSDLRPI